MGGYRRLLRLFSGPSSVTRELDEELDTHLAMRVEEYVRRGLSPEAAEEAARRQLGDRRRLHASARRRDRLLLHRDRFDGLRHDLLVTWRRARSAPGPTLLTLLTLAVGIGLTSAGFTVVDRVLLRALPLPEPDRLVILENMNEERETFPYIAAATWREWERNAHTLASSAIHRQERLTVALADGAVRADGALVAGDLFGVLAVPLLQGRGFTAAESQRDERVAVVSAGFWRRVLGADPALPLTVRIEGEETLVVGVLDDDLAYPAGTEIWLAAHPLEWSSGTAHTWINWRAVARLAPEVGVEAATAELSGISRGIRQLHPEAIYAYGARAVPLRDHLVGGSREQLLMLAGAVAFVLLVACANLAGLGFARSATRSREMGIRSAIGAARGRLLRQLLTEQLALAAAGGALGLLLAVWLVGIVTAIGGAFLPRALEIVVDGRVVVVTLALSGITGLLAGVLPALRASRDAPAAALSGSRGSVGDGRRLPGASLVAIEVALAVLLLTGGSLLLRSHLALLDRDLGYRTEGVLTATIDLPETDYEDPEERLRLWQRLSDRLRTAPGVEEAALAHWTPGGVGGRGFVEFPDRHLGEQVGAGYNVVSDDYFRLLGVPLKSGRSFDDRDRGDSERVGMVNETMAERFWPGEDPIGRRLRAVSMEIMEGAPWITVVGVVADTRYYGHAADPQPEMYALYRQVPSWSATMTLTLRVADGMDPTDVVPAVRRTLSEEDPELAADFSTLTERIDALVGWRRFVTAMLSGFAAISVLLAAVGLYGLLSFVVARRTREIGVRMALGADRAGVVRLMVSGAARPLAGGAAVGIGSALLLSGVLRSLLVETAPHDPTAYAMATGVLLLAAAGAVFIPVLRAVRTDPMVALRVD